MKKIMLVVFQLIIASIFSNAFAGGLYEDFNISELRFSRGSNNVNVIFNGGTGNPNPDGCDKSDRFLLPLTSDHQQRETAMLSALSIAYATNKTVTVYLSDCFGALGNGTAPGIWYLYIKN